MSKLMAASLMLVCSLLNLVLHFIPQAPAAEKYLPPQLTSVIIDISYQPSR